MLNNIKTEKRIGDNPFVSKTRKDKEKFRKANFSPLKYGRKYSSDNNSNLEEISSPITATKKSFKNMKHETKHDFNDPESKKSLNKMRSLHKNKSNAEQTTKEDTLKTKDDNIFNE